MKHEDPQSLRQGAHSIKGETWPDVLPRVEDAKEKARAAILDYARVSSDPAGFLLTIAGDLLDADVKGLLMHLDEALSESAVGRHEDASNSAEAMVDMAIAIRDDIDLRLMEVS